MLLYIPVKLKLRAGQGRSKRDKTGDNRSDRGKIRCRWSPRDLAGLREFISVTPNCKAAILAYNGTRALKLGGRLWAIPLDVLLS